MDPAGQLSLPIETLHHIGQYLSVEDVLNLSRTCHYLRSALNDNSIWKRYVSGNICQLESLEQQVQPVFQCAETLSPLCEYRVNYMRQVHLVNNWRNGNQVKHSTRVDQGYTGAVVTNNNKGSGPCFYNNRYIFLEYSKSGLLYSVISVWDVNDTPVLHSFLPVRCNNFKMYLFESKLVVVQCKRVSVYQITLPAQDFPLLYSFIINEPEVSWQEEAVHFACDDNCVMWGYYLVNHYLISIQCYEGNIFYVWNILNATKVGTFVTPLEGFGVSLECHEGDDWILQQYQRSGSKTLIFSFNINNQKFSETNLEFDNYLHHSICYKSQVFIFKEFDEDLNMKCKVLCTVYNCKTLTEINNQVFRNVRARYGVPPNTVIVNDKFVILCSNSVLIVGSQSLEIIGEIQFNVNVGLVTHQFSFYGSLIIAAVSLTDDGYYHHDVWDVEKKQKLPESLGFLFSHRTYFNDTYSKIVSLMVNKIKVGHFW